MYLLFYILENILSLVILFTIIACFVTTNSKLKDLEDVRKNLQGLPKALKSIEEIREKVDILIERVDVLSGKVNALSDKVVACRHKGIYRNDSPVSSSEYGKSLPKK